MVRINATISVIDEDIDQYWKMILFIMKHAIGAKH